MNHYSERLLLHGRCFLELCLTDDGNRFVISFMESEFPYKQLGFMELPGGAGTVAALEQAARKLLEALHR